MRLGGTTANSAKAPTERLWFEHNRDEVTNQNVFPGHSFLLSKMIRSIIHDLEESKEARRQANGTVHYILVNNYLWIIFFILQSSQHLDDRDSVSPNVVANLPSIRHDFDA